ncbi:MAG: hypothetical protein KC419_06315 [Anaerolineales bacterium]|nr:hypothetical protein [Anaerolineales bacterium]
MMIDTPLEAIIALVFLSLVLCLVARDFYAVWFQYGKFQSKAIRNYRRFNGSFARSRGYFASVSRHWILHRSYKWFARIIFTIGFLGLVSAWVTLIIYIFFVLFRS